MSEPEEPSTAPVRRIVHVDLDAFFASVEQRDQPSLRGKPVAVGGEPRHHGVVAAASYEARRFGVRSAMPMSQALRLCPRLIVVPPQMGRYREVSEQMFELFREVTPLVEPLAMDEAFLDVTENAWGVSLGVEVARRLKKEIRARTQLTASAGVAPNKFLAKVASGLRKPDGLAVIAPERVEATLRTLRVEDLWGVGPVTAARLHEAGLRSLIDFRTAPRALLERLVGSSADRLLALSHGIDPRPVHPNRERHSVGAERTYSDDLKSLRLVREAVTALAQRVGGYLEEMPHAARTVTLKARYSDFTTVTRSFTSTPPLRSGAEVKERALELIEKTDAGRRPIRLLGVSLHGFSSADAEPRSSRVGITGQLELPFGPQNSEAKE